MWLKKYKLYLTFLYKANSCGNTTWLGEVQYTWLNCTARAWMEIGKGVVPQVITPVFMNTKTLRCVVSQQG
jgi:hypothetical protein